MDVNAGTACKCVLEIQIPQLKIRLRVGASSVRFYESKHEGAKLSCGKLNADLKACGRATPPLTEGSVR